MAGLIILVALIVLAIIVPFAFKLRLSDARLKNKKCQLQVDHIGFGTDDFGRDLWTRVWWEHVYPYS